MSIEMREIRTHRTVRCGVVTLGALVALGAPAAAFAAEQPADTAKSVSASAEVVAAKGKLVKTQRMFDGSTVKIYKSGDRFSADVFYKGKKIGTLGPNRTVLKHHGVDYSFHPYKGKVWAEKGKGKGGQKRDDVKPIPNPTPDDDEPIKPIPNPTPDDAGDITPADTTAVSPASHSGMAHSIVVAQQGKAGKKLVRVTGMVDGSVAKIYKVGKKFRAEITSKGSPVGAINGRGEITYGETGGLGVVHAKLYSNGKITSWLTSPKPKPGAGQDDQRKDDEGKDDVVPQPEPQPDDAASMAA
ncbi:hypothetical protein AB0C93_37700 [Streptomyces sp. NPDC048518]|uniref:hypothetical protein n=1 Tax=Streptomyces sp. NPDC048518 TaxID=3155029 RepID=UPI0033C598B4